MQKSIGYSSALALMGVVGLLAVTAPAHAQLVNGTFESANTSGHITGWTLNNSTHVTVVTSADGETPVDGTHFARLLAADGNKDIMLDQAFTVAKAGQVISGSAYFQANGAEFDKFGDNTDDFGYVKILLNGTPLFQSDIAAVGTNGTTGWQTFSYTFAAKGSYTIEAGVENVFNNQTPSSLGLDNVTLSLPSNALTTPEGSSLFMLVAGGLPFAAIPVLRRRRK